MKKEDDKKEKNEKPKNIVLEVQSVKHVITINKEKKENGKMGE